MVIHKFLLTKYIIFLLIIINLFTSCDTLLNKQNLDEINKEEIKNYSAINNLVYFSQSHCIPDCENDTGKILVNQIIQDTLYLQIAHWMNCAYKKSEIKDIKEYEDIINISFTLPNEEIETDKNGIVSKSHSYTECNCYFIFDLVLKNIKTKPNTIYVNSHPINNTIWHFYQ